LYEAWGPVESMKAFVHYPAHSFPNQDTALKDDTHFNTYGAYEIARCIVKGLQQSNLGIKKNSENQYLILIWLIPIRSANGIGHSVH